MNRFILSALSLCCFSYVAFAQDYQNCIQVISSAGKYAVQGNLSFSYTIGEPVITTLAGASRKLTQGFHQPELCKVVATFNPDLADWNIEVFPNPTADYLTIRYSDQQSGSLHATVYNLYGQVMIDDQVLSSPGGSSVNCTDWQSGVYILQLKDTATLNVASTRFIRL